MTHDELLKALTKSDSEFYDLYFMHSARHNALISIVGLHKPEGINAPPQCAHDRRGYPCLTIQAIEKELK